MKRILHFNHKHKMENIDIKAEKLGLDRGYYLLLMAIMDIPTESEDDNIEAA